MTARVHRARESIERRDLPLFGNKVNEEAFGFRCGCLELRVENKQSGIMDNLKLDLVVSR